MVLYDIDFGSCQWRAAKLRHFHLGLALELQPLNIFMDWQQSPRVMMAESVKVASNNRDSVQRHFLTMRSAN